MSVDQITTLQTQQGLLTQALKAAVEGKWTGEGSVEAFLYALDPSMNGSVTPDPPITTSEWEESPKA